jgi:hypothetical protein
VELACSDIHLGLALNPKQMNKREVRRRASLLFFCRIYDRIGAKERVPL